MDPRLKRNVLWKAIEAFVTIVASFVQLGVISRSYVPDLVGQYQLTLAWLFLVSALSCFAGIVMVASRELTHNVDGDRRAVFSSALVLQATVALLLCVGCVFIFRHSTHFSALSVPLTVGSLALLGAVVLQLSQALLVSQEQIGKLVSASIIGHAIATGAVTIASWYGASIHVLVTAWATYNIANGVIVTFQTKAWRLISCTLVSATSLYRLAIEALPILVMVLATHLYVRVDIIMLDYFTTKEVVAQYSAGYLFLDQLMILSNCMMGALFPNFARSCLSRGSDYQVLYHGIIRLFVKYLVPLAAAIAVFSRVLLGALYGATYAEAWLSLSVLMVAAICAWLNGPSGTIFVSLKKQHIYMWATLLSLAVNVVANLLFIPTLGAVGAAVSTVLTEAAICSFCLWWIHRETGYLPWMPPRSDEP